ncbi:MAG: N-6 DNA methylase, partial [Deltaproteobacteria bacterium]|nr:N-6 DNA methylase [Deltaproteobacteria bacterium]
ASNSRILFMKYTDYPERWDEIADIFSHEAILKGSFDKYVESKKAKRGTAEVDSAFLKEIERWRDLLARNIALRNPDLSQRELNFAVQRTIDRIIFLRISEDRGIETYGTLMALQNGNQVYKRMFQIFRQADDRYNSGLFHFQREKGRSDDSLDTLTSGLNIDDRVLKDILKNLYYPDSPYEFSVLPANILGQVYEQFLGKVIRLTPAHHAVVEDKPEVRKAGGVYYTPTYIVDYIVKQTVGKLIEGKKPGPRSAVSKLKILDPACGSGSFLLGAYQFLLDWHRDEYIKDDPKKWATGGKPRLYQSPGGDWRLTTDERKRILLNNIYGVDIDPQAVETTKLSLLLKVLEGEDEQTLGHQLSMFQERVLPDLANNIKCGNSLIGPDFYEGQQMSLMDEEETYRINAFDWQAEFPEIMSAGGFDAVIGNPPWISLTGKFGTGIYPKSEIKYLIHKFAGNTYMPNMYEYFVAKGINLLAFSGYFGYIVPDRLGFNSQFVGLRRKILDKTQIISLIYRAPFPEITADTLMFIVYRSKRIDSKLPVEIGEYGRELLKIPQLEFKQDPTYSFQYYDSVGALNLIKKI